MIDHDRTAGLRRPRAGRMAARVVLLLSVVGSAGACHHPRRVVYEIPRGFHGEVVAEYAVADCPGLETRQGTLLFPIPEDGLGCASDEFAESGSDVEVVVAGGQPAQRVPPGTPAAPIGYWDFHQAIETDEEGHVHRSETFFVGSAVEHEEFRKSRGARRGPAVR